MVKKAKKLSGDRGSISGKKALEEQKLLEDVNEAPKETTSVSDDPSIQYELEMTRIRAQWTPRI